ncbi:DUF938 domain-containing protein [Brevundimonas sp. 2R-24]|uniref:DUF938 domain-containing protein n=1 Tax=Peiella sedimenti TaxID=3061083 RepID=A0ABT8SQ28_9CAUL|nr:DUF938 domain-containing protein [Caulobacteraceae bacterium XZ-24]
MISDPPPGARTAPAAARNRGPILQILRPRLGPGDRVLEIASGSGEHAVFLTEALPRIDWTPSDPDPEALHSIAAWRAAAGRGNLKQPLALDVADQGSWPEGPFDALFCANMIHISPWTATEALMRGAGRVLRPGGRLFLYGPFREADRPFAPSNAAFDEGLRARDPRWGVRDLDAVKAEALGQGLILTERLEMPANNLTVVFEKA